MWRPVDTPTYGPGAGPEQANSANRLEHVKDALERGEGIEIRGFGPFKVRRRKRRTARNPKTGEPVEVAARAAPVFQPSSLLRERVTGVNASE